MVEHRTVNARVSGSNPAVPANSGREVQRYEEEGREL